jgi:hypothetical protein
MHADNAFTSPCGRPGLLAAVRDGEVIMIDALR